MMRTRSTWLMIAPLTLTLLLAILIVGCSAFGPSAQEISNQTAIAGIQASLAALNDQRAMTVEALRQQNTAVAATTTQRAVDTRERANSTATAISAAATATAGSALSEANAPAGWKLIFYDPFEDDHMGWPIGPDDSNQWAHVDTEMVDGVYQWKSTAKQGFFYSGYPGRIGGFSDFYAYTDAKLEDGEPGTAYGMIFRWSAGDLYAFEVTEQGTWWIGLRKNGLWDAIKSGRSGQIVSGGNHLAVKGEGSSYTFYANNQEITTITDDRLTPAGYAGVLVEMGFGGAKSTVTFDSFTVLTR